MSKTLNFANGTSIAYVERITDKDYIQGADREVIEFRFDPTTVTLDQIDGLFSEAACTKLTASEVTINKVEHYKDVEVQVPVIGEDGEPTGETTTETKTELDYIEDVPVTEQFVYDDYVVRCILSRQLFPVMGENGIENVEYISVRMAQRTYAETKIAAMSNDITNTQLALVDVYETVIGGTL